ncbi:tRNA pseudouridine synthase A, mitochondrial-like [Durio zibethinus]|uniref:tRNA pseudouridine synthase A, mitochondrial-like n=1 Tax=Durio zibethinus TaxID=66656 RepID=A0A6P5Z0W0_DURZI|nr:tRNA pseudouridine synthase A, mitochondrial-like [Durio zibethinus]XP_022746170.1 tRNA pseudouridine synthase A, mitochondrial-like [Durio zibethinus]
MDTSDTSDTKIVASPPPLQEPEPKKLKMSTTATSDDEEEAAATTGTKKLRYKRRKIAMFFAYCGVGYQGMQKNPGAKTIEGDLEEALFHSGAVPEQDRGNSKRYDWARSARTDKGVSAVGQVVSGRFYIDPPGLVERLNQILPAQIRIFGYKRVTASFNAKKFCDRRRYVYLIPVFALDPSCHRDRESVLASLGSDNELVKCLECSERGRKVVGVMGKRISFEPISTIVQSDIYSNNGDTGNAIKEDIQKSELKLATDGSVQNEFTDMENTAIKEDNLTSELKEATDGAVQNEVTEMQDTGVEQDKVNLDKKPMEERRFCYGEEEKERFNRILKHYVGSHNFHNFTTRIKAEDPAARRYIVSFHANTVVTVEGIDFVKCEVVGQSFMLHQIRKMIGMAVAVMRDFAPESLIETALRKDVNINVPTAPEVGLYLDECLFASYNEKWKDSHEELSMKAYEEEAEKFKMKFIYSHIASTEREEGVVALWLHSLNHRNYPDLQVCSRDTIEGKSPKVDDNADTIEEKSNAVEKNGDTAETQSAKE